MLRQKRVTPRRQLPSDPSEDNPLHVHKVNFAKWSVAIGLSPYTAAIRVSALNHFIRWCHGQGICALSAIDRDALEAYQCDLAAYRKPDGERLALNTQAARLYPLKAFCKWLVRKRLVAHDPSLELLLPRMPRRLPRRIPSVAEAKRILSGAGSGDLSSLRDRAMMEMLYSTALRRLELARLRTADVNFDTSTVFVRSGKCGHDRIVPLGTRASHWALRYLQDARPRLQSGLDRGEMFLTDYGEPFSKNRLGDRIRRYVARAGLPGACHIFRHACATHMLENGADIRFIQAMLGHAQLSTTEIYTQVSISKLKEIHAATHPAQTCP
jgi:integrase/recombinase XerD